MMNEPIISPWIFYWIEVIDVSKQGSHGKHMGFDELTDFFKALPEHFQPGSIGGSEFIAW